MRNQHEEHAVYLFHGANQFFFSQGQVLYRTHHPTQGSENEEPWVQAGFSCHWDKDDLCPNWNFLFLHCLFANIKSKSRELMRFYVPPQRKQQECINCSTVIYEELKGNIQTLQTVLSIKHIINTMMGGAASPQTCPPHQKKTRTKLFRKC